MKSDIATAQYIAAFVFVVLVASIGAWSHLPPTDQSPLIVWGAAHGLAAAALLFFIHLRCKP